MRKTAILAAALIAASSLASNNAYALPPAPTPPVIPPPPIHVVVPTWVWVAMACPASIILSGAVANFKDNRQLTTAEAWTCGLLYWIPMPYQPNTVVHHHHH